MTNSKQVVSILVISIAVWPWQVKPEPAATTPAATTPAATTPAATTPAATTPAATTPAATTPAATTPAAGTPVPTADAATTNAPGMAQDATDLRGWGIATGFVYLQGVGRGAYISSASVDVLGYVRVKNNLQRINRVFPSITGFVKPGCLPAATSKQRCNFFIGGTIGVPTGASNEGGGSPMAFGLTLGMVAQGIHVGIFGGIIQDPSIKVLPWYLVPNGPFPDQGIQSLLTAVRQGNNSPGLALFQGLELPLTGVTGRYTSFGLVVSISI